MIVEKKTSYLCLLASILMLSACSLFWKSYQHPSYYFSFKHPKAWVLQEESAFQTQLSILMSTQEELFQPNINFVIQDKTKLDLEQTAYLANKQLSNMLMEFQLLSKTKIKISGYNAIELRSQYSVINDPRILRTIIFKTDDLEYTLTFSCRKNQEKDYAQQFATFLKTLNVPKSVAIARE